MLWNSRITGAALSLGLLVRADPTWPSQIDELEEIMYQTTGYRNRQFGGTVMPCNNEASGPGRQNAAEWLRTAFHDMATSQFFDNVRTGGLDASIQYELGISDNAGPVFNTTLTFMAEYLTSRSSLADLIALGTYYSVRSCGGPVVPIRGGRIDATEEGPLTGTPLPQNTAFTFEQQFIRMGFTKEEMIQVTACGHTIGNVHAAQFPQIVPVGSAPPNDSVPMDGTVAAFDNKVVTEYLDGTTTNPLVVGPSIKATRNSDFKVFNYDSNATVSAMAEPDEFNNVCATVLQKMIDTVPDDVTLTEPIQPYAVKPVNMQLTINGGGSTMALSGFIRVRTTEMTDDSVSTITVTYKNRDGGDSCGSSSCSFDIDFLGQTQGFDDTFLWFPVNQYISTATGISSFTLTLNMESGATKEYDNNGETYPMDDAIILQKPQSCMLGSSGALTVTAAVRNDRNSEPVDMLVSYRAPTGDSIAPIPTLKSGTVAMTKGNCVGRYTLYTAEYTLPADMGYSAKIDVISGSGASAIKDDFNNAHELAGTCRTFEEPPASVCTTGSGPGSTTTTSTTTTGGGGGVTSTSSTTSPPTITSSATTFTTMTSSSTAGPVETGLRHRQTMGGYDLVGCKTEATGRRALGDATFVYNGMTLESCMGNCTGYNYWGTEYGNECYCGDTLHSTSQDAVLADCNMKCSGDETQYCGAGNRIELYRTTSISTPTATLAPKPTVSSYTRVGCYSEIPNGRALNGATKVDPSMTLEMCAGFCSDFQYWAAEYGTECYCGDVLNQASKAADEGDCNMVCAGDKYEYCGAGNRLELYSASSAGAA